MPPCRPAEACLIDFDLLSRLALRDRTCTWRLDAVTTSDSVEFLLPRGLGAAPCLGSGTRSDGTTSTGRESCTR